LLEKNEIEKNFPIKIAKKINFMKKERNFWTKMELKK